MSSRFTLPSDVLSGAAIQPSSSSACVAIYDGPKYSIIALPNSTSGFSVSALKNTDVAATMPDVVGYYGDNACLFFRPTNGFVPYPLDNPATYNSGYGRDISDAGGMVGYAVGSTKKAVYWSDPHSPALLGSLPSGGASEAFAISTNGLYVAGYAVNSSSTPHAVRWDNPSWSAPRDFSALNGASTTASYGYGVNSTGQVVGASLGGTNNASALRAFRTAAGAATITSADELRPFFDTNLNLAIALGLDTIVVSNFVSAATAINSSGTAVGWSDAGVVTWWDSFGRARGEAQHRAHYWGTDGVPVNLGVLPGGNWSEATAINDGGMVVGSSRTSTNINSVVGFISGGAGTTMISVQDQHLFYGSTNWHLTRPVDINNWSYILGNGTYEGSPASWLLIPLY